MTTALAALNSFRYRGYVYDEETGLYYLRSRYYNPEWGRFINADTVLGQGGALLRHNLFAYFGNDPVNFHDPDGYKGSLLRFMSAFFFDESIGSGHIGTVSSLSPLVVEVRVGNTSLMSFEYTDVNGQHLADEVKLAQFERAAFVKNRPDYSSVLAIAGFAALSDSFLHGPGDLIASCIIVISCAIVYLASGNGNPRSLEGGMSSYQKEMFQREIEDWKKYRGIKPNDNILWEVLVEIAREIIENYRKK